MRGTFKYTLNLYNFIIVVSKNQPLLRHRCSFPGTLLSVRRCLLLMVQALPLTPDEDQVCPHQSQPYYTSLTLFGIAQMV